MSRRAIVATIRRIERGYLVESRGGADPARTRYPTLVAALNASPTYRHRWRPVRPDDLHDGSLGADVLYVVDD